MADDLVNALMRKYAGDDFDPASGARHPDLINALAQAYAAQAPLRNRLEGDPAWPTLPPMPDNRPSLKPYGHPGPPRWEREVAEGISPTMGAYGLAGLATTAAMDAGHGKYDPATLGPLAAAIFAGPRAKTADLGALTRAQEMAAKGADRGAIWSDTGWFQGKDGKWRWEIDDSKSTFDPSQVSAKMPSRHDIAHQIVADMGLPRHKLLNDAALQERVYPEADKLLAGARDAEKGQPLATALTHDPLFAAYPEMMQVGVAHDNLPNYMGTFRDNRITFGGGRRLYDEEPNHLSTVLHEGQHKLQDIEKWARGGNKEEFAADAAFARAYDQAWLVNNRVKNLGEKPSEAAMYIANAPDGIGDATQLLYLASRYSQDELAQLAKQYKPENRYKALYGEVEARNTQKRMDMTPEERRATPPWETEDVPYAQQIVRLK